MGCRSTVHEQRDGPRPGCVQEKISRGDREIRAALRKEVSTTQGDCSLFGYFNAYLLCQSRGQKSIVHSKEKNPGCQKQISQTGWGEAANKTINPATDGGNQQRLKRNTDHNDKTNEIRWVQAVLEEEESKDGQAKKSRYVQNPGCSKKTRKSRSVFQTALTAKIPGPINLPSPT